jgi:hypothetical protein
MIHSTNDNEILILYRSMTAIDYFTEGYYGWFIDNSYRDQPIWSMGGPITNFTFPFIHGFGTVQNFISTSTLSTHEIFKTN